MSFNGTGTFILNVGGYPYVPNTLIVSANVNALLQDIANGLSLTVTRDGQMSMTGPLHMANQLIDGVKNLQFGTTTSSPSGTQDGFFLTAAHTIGVGINGSTIASWTSTGMTFTGSLSAAAFIPTGSTVPVNGMYLPAANTVGFVANSIEYARVTSTGNWSFNNASTGNAVTANTGLGTSAIFPLAFVSNNAGNYPATGTTTGTIGNNFSAGGGEVDFWNNQTSATEAFRFLQQTGASAATVLGVWKSNGNLLVNGTTDLGAGYAIQAKAATANSNLLVDIRNSGTTGGSLASTLQLVTTTANASAYFQLNDNSGSPFAVVQVGTAVTNLYLDAPIYNFRSQNGATTFATLQASGLTVTGTSGGLQLLIGTPTNNNVFQFATQDSSTANIYFGNTNTTHAFIGTNVNCDLNLLANSLTRIVIGTSGNVSINAPTSGTSLTVAGGTSASAVIVNSGSGAAGITVNQTGAANNAVSVLGPAATQLNAFSLTQGAQTGWALYQAASDNNLRFFGGRDVMLMNTSGNVVINAPSSGTGLAVSGVAGALAITTAGSGVNSVHIDNGQATTTAASAAINTSETYVTASFPISANQLQVGDSFRVLLYGTCTSTVANTSTITVRLGSAGTTADTSISAQTFTAAATGTNQSFCMDFYVTVRAAGSSGSIEVNGILITSGSGISTVTAGTWIPTTTTINTTGALFLGASYKTSAVTTTSTFIQCITQRLM